MEDTWQVKSGSAWPHLPPPSSLVPPLPPAAAPMPDSANQMGLNSLQFSRSFVQKTNLRDNAAVREPMVFNTLNLDSCKSGKGELANSFLGLISGDSHHVSSGVLSLPYSSSLSTKLRVCDGGIVSSASFGVPNTSIPPLLEAHGNDVMGNGRRSPFVASRPLSTFTSNKSPFLHSNFQVVASPRHDIDSCKLATHQAFQGNVAGSEAISSRHGLPTMPSSLNTNQQHTLNWKSEKMPLEAKPSISSHSSTFQGRPHVFCMNKVGELFVSDMGLLGVICFCHKLPMSVAKFCEHSGLTSADPSEAVRLENGMTVAQWRVLCSGIMASDPSNGWDWSDGSSSEGFFARSKSSNLPTSSKNPLSINSIEAFGGVGRYGGHPNLFTFANHTSAGLGGQIASGKSPNKDADNAHSSNGSMTHNPFPKCFTASMKSSMLLARNHTVQEARGSPVCISFQGAHSTLNKGKQSTGAQLIPNNANSKGEIGNLPVFYPCLGTEKASNCNNHIHRGNISKEEACAAAQDGIDLRLGHPSHNDHTSRNAFENSKHCLQSGTIFNSKGPQLTHMSVFPREAKKTTINPQCMSLEASLFDRTSHHAVGSGSLKNSESEDPTSDATKNSLVMFLSHLNSEGNRPSQFANNIGRDNECHMTRVPDTDFLYAEGNLSDLTGVIHDGTERKSNRYGSILSNNIDQVKEQGELDDNSNRTLNPSYSVNIKQPINTSIHAPGCCIHSSLMDYKQSKSNYNQPSCLLRTLSETSNSNQCAEVCFPGNYNLYDHDLHIPTSSVPKGTEKPGLINLETSTSLSLTNSTYISKQDFGLSDWKNTDRTQNLGDGSFRSFSLRNMAEVSKPEQSTLPLEMCPQQRRLLDLGSQKKAYKDALMPPEVLRGPYCSIERDGPKVTARSVHSFSNCYSGGATQMLSGKSGTTGPCKFCNCCASTKRKTFPQEYGIQFSLSQPNICHAHEQPCLRLGRISDISHSDSVNSELYNQREKNSSVSMKCCCAALPMCLTGCCFPRGDKLSSALDEHGCSRSRIIYSNPPYDNSHMLQDGKRIRLGQCACLRKHVPVKNDRHNALWRDVSNKGIRHFGTTIETPIDNLHITRTIEDQITEISGKELEGIQQESSMKEQQMSNVCSGTSAPALTEVSVEVGNSVTLAMDVENTKIVHDLVVDEGSRIEKSGSSDEEHDSRLCAELLTLKDKVKSGLHCGQSSSSVGIVNELRLKSSNLKRLRNDISHRCTGKESTDQIKQFKRVEKAEKKMEPMKWSILDASFQMSTFPSQCSESSEHVGGSSNHSSSKEIEPLSQPELVMQETCILSNRSSSVKRKRSALSSSKSFFVKRLENHHITGEYNRMLSIHDDHSLRKKKVSSGKKIKENLDRMMIQKDIHVTAEKTPKYISLSCIGNSPDLVMDTSYNTGKPIVCDNSGIISSGPSDRQKPAKIVPLSLILKKASRCSITKYKEKPREAFISKSQLNANSRQWKACEDADSSDVIRNGVNPTIGFSGNEQHTSNLCSKKILKHALLADSRLVNSSHNDQGLMSKQYEENKSKVHEGKSSLDSEAFCCVCGSSKKEDLNHLLECNRCLVRVHQACYGVSKVPKGHWCCRPCKTNSLNIVCVLCGYGGGAMTRALKTTNTVKSLLKAWKVGIRSHLINCVPFKGIKNDFLKLDSVSDASDCDLGSISSGFFPRAVSEMDLQETNTIQHSDGFPNDFQACNSIATGIIDPSVTQWVHMVCGLWTPGTRCPNVDTMSAFDVSGALTARNGIVCSMCNRPGGSCIQCRVLNCSVHFHPWCAHTKGLLQSEIEGDDNEKVGFYGRCLLHATHNSCDPVDTEVESPRTKDWACARTEGFKGRKRDEGFNCNRVKPCNDGGCIVSQEQINVWLHINGQKSCTRGVVKLPCSDMEYDIRKEYIRYKQLKGWKQLVVYKSGIHALGLYTSQFIAKGAMVVEYVGEIVGLRVADKRELEYQSGRRLQYKSACYFFRIDKEHIIDATRKGGIARFVNHSCLPNCVAKIISIRNEKKVVFFAERDIFPGEEITYDYHFNHEDEGKKIPCFCNSKNCRRYLN